MSIINSFPTTLVNGQPADATVVMSLFNWIQSQVNANASSSSVVAGGIAIPNFTIDHSTPNGRVLFPSTNPSGWNTGFGRMSVDFTVTPTNYFAANPNGHFAVVLRQDPALVTTAVRGQGIAVGNATGFTQPSNLNPTPLLETWFNGIGAGNYLWGNSESARSYKMIDGRAYRIIVDSTKAGDGNRYLRYRMWSLQAGLWYAEVDTGDVLDWVNTGADLTQSALAFGQVFESNLSTWSLPFTNVNVTWGPAENAVPDQTIKLSRFGAQLEGDLNLIGTGRTISFPSGGAGPSLANAASIQTSTADASTTLVVKPNGTSTASNLFFSNSYSTTTYKCLIVGAAGNIGQLVTYDTAGSSPNIEISPGGVPKLTVKTGGLNFLGASVDVGTPVPYSAGLTNFGDYNALVFTLAAALNIDTFCTDGQIAAFLGGTYSATNIQNVLRPLYCLVSVLIADLKNKKVI